MKYKPASDAPGTVCLYALRRDARSVNYRESAGGGFPVGALLATEECASVMTLALMAPPMVVIR